MRAVVPLLACAVFACWAGHARALPDDGLEERLAALRHSWDDEELPLEALALDLDQATPGRIPAPQAAEDVERLFHLLSHGYSGYAFFDGGGRFDGAREGILRDLGSRTAWSVEDLATLFRNHLPFIRDLHTRIGGLPYGEHRDFWCDPDLEFRRQGAGYVLDAAEGPLVVESIGGGPPEDSLRPSLAEDGRAVFRVGTLSSTRPEPLPIEVLGAGGPRTLRAALRNSDHFSYSGDLFREDRVGGIPVVRIRTFSDHHSADLERFLETAGRHRGAPCLIVDLRGNGGGNEKWVVEWIRRFTGKRAGSVFITSELNSRTSLMGRANYMTQLFDRFPGTALYGSEAAGYTDRARAIGTGDRAPFWSGPFRPDNPPIPNPTTLVLVTNGHVASAGEGFVMRARQAENVVVVGENTQGALTFGNVSLHRLPRSGMEVLLPVNFGLFRDLVFREETGLSPDYWVPAGDAVNAAVAALRRGTLPTLLPLPADRLDEPFQPEDPDHRQLERARRRWLIVAFGVLAGLLWSRLLSRRPGLLAGLGAASLAVGGAWILLTASWTYRARNPGYAFLAIGGLGLVSGAVLRWRALRRAGGRGEAAGPPVPPNGKDRRTGAE